jgi:hypothetical protein
LGCFPNPLPLSYLWVSIESMSTPNKLPRLGILITGDLVTLAIVTLVGFATHAELGAVARMPTTFIPLVISWLLVAPFFGVFDLPRIQSWKSLWRPFYAMVVAGPLAAWMRGMWLGAPILPIFVVVLGGFAALGLLAWRIIFWFLWLRRKAFDG